METIRIGLTDVIFKDEGVGKGKIIVSNDDWGYNFSHYWGAMGDRHIKQFVAEVNTDYFVNKLSTRLNGDLDVKKTFRNIRKRIREALAEEGISWYKHMDFQKDMREEINRLQSEVCSDQQLVSELSDFHSRLNYYDIEDRYDRQTVESVFRGVFDECWHMFEYQEPRENLFLADLHKKLVKVLKKS